MNKLIGGEIIIIFDSCMFLGVEKTCFFSNISNRKKDWNKIQIFYFHEKKFQFRYKCGNQRIRITSLYIAEIRIRLFDYSYWKNVRLKRCKFREAEKPVNILYIFRTEIVNKNFIDSFKLLIHIWMESIWNLYQLSIKVLLFIIILGRNKCKFK